MKYADHVLLMTKVERERERRRNFQFWISTLRQVVCLHVEGVLIPYFNGHVLAVIWWGLECQPKGEEKKKKHM